MANIQQGKPEYELEDFDEDLDERIGEVEKIKNPVFEKKIKNVNSYERGLLKKHFFKNPLIDTKRLEEFRTVCNHIENIEESEVSLLLDYFTSMDGEMISDNLCQSVIKAMAKVVGWVMGDKELYNVITTDKTLAMVTANYIGQKLLDFPQEWKVILLWMSNIIFNLKQKNVMEASFQATDTREVGTRENDIMDQDVQENI